MFAIILLIAATTGVVAVARRRGGNPWLWGVLTIVAFFAVPFLLGGLLGATGVFRRMSPDDVTIAGAIGQWGGVGLVFLAARFWLGGGQASAGSIWVCPNCKYLNQPGATICEACKAPYAAKT